MSNLKTNAMKKTLLLISAAVCLFSACEEEDDNKPKVVTEPDYVIQTEQAVILYEGSYQKNNSDLSELSVKVNGLSADVYYKANGKYLGDTGQDLLHIGQYYYVSVFGSGYVTKLEEGTYKEVARHTLSQPRYLASDSEYLYVSSYANCVYRLSLDDLSVNDSVSVGSYPEGLAIEGNWLLCCNSGYGFGNTISVVDLKTFEAVKDVAVPQNPTKIKAAGNGCAYFITTAYTPDYSSAIATLSSLDVDNGFAVDSITHATHMDLSADGNWLYLVNCEPNYTSYTYETSFAKYDLRARSLSEAFFDGETITDTLATQSIYLFNINPKNGEIFVGTSDYTSNSSIYVTDSLGRGWCKIEDAGGVNASKVVF